MILNMGYDQEVDHGNFIYDGRTESFLEWDQISETTRKYVKEWEGKALEFRESLSRMVAADKADL